MKTGRAAKVIVGVLTGAYVLMPLIFIVSWFLIVGSIAFTAGSGDPESTFPFFAMLVFLIFPVLVCGFTLLNYGLIIYYIVHLVKNRAGSETLRIVLAAGFLVMPWLALPLYYLVYILPANVPDWALQPAPAEA